MAEPAGIGAQGVPQHGAERNLMRAKLRQWTRAAGLVPPLDLEQLQAGAARAAREAGIAPEYRDFATVLVGNAAWERPLAAVPFTRRVLLLPKCLRAPESCRAPVDELGLSCVRCGGCAVDELTSEAEALGYHVLVAEGTTAVASLAETGVVEGVVAVACLHSLERCYAAASAGAVPAMAIPLLQAGCRATSVDPDWVRDALRLRSHTGGTRRVDLDGLRDRVRGWFAADALRPLLCREGTATEALALEAVAGGGKRWRPTLAAAVHEALTGGLGRCDEVRRVAVAVECFHKASLVHDDIEDADLLRDGAPTLHADHGTPIALNAGDLLIGEGYRLIAEAGLDAATTGLMLKAAALAQRELCLGQGAELAWSARPVPLTREEALQLLRRKTAPAFELPLVLGAALGGADERTCEALRALSTALGLAYQVRDDLRDAPSAAERPAPSPLFAALALEEPGVAACSPAHRYLHGRLQPHERRELLARLAPAATDLFAHFRAESLRALRPLADPALKAMLFRLVHLFLGSASASERGAPDAAAGRDGKRPGEAERRGDAA